MPIFNPLNNRRADTNIIGELDKWGGHSGRADDYHYHIAPVHLEEKVGKGNPVAYALDGYPIYGYDEPDGSKVAELDWLNGHKDAAGHYHYHYHATTTYPYLNGGFYGEVVERGGQVDPQPRAQVMRPSLTPLAGAKITGFTTPTPGSYSVQLDVRGEKRFVNYAIADDGSVTYNFVDSSGTRTETYERRQRGGGRRDGDGGQRGGPPRADAERTSERRSPNERGRVQGRGPVGQPQRGGGEDPIAQALDSNRDGQIDEAELLKAAEALRALDRNSDGQISAEELRPKRGVQDSRDQGTRDRPSGQASGPRPDDGPRQSWILVHADEIDLNKDKIISKGEIVGEATKAFADYDVNNDGKLSESELSGRGGSRSAMGGFLKGHSKEIDRNADGILTRAEAIGNAERMFGKMDANKDDKISEKEMESSRRR